MTAYNITLMIDAMMIESTPHPPHQRRFCTTEVSNVFDAVTMEDTYWML